MKKEFIGVGGSKTNIDSDKLFLKSSIIKEYRYLPHVK